MTTSPAAESGVISVTIKVNGSAAPDTVEFSHIRVETGVGRPGRAVVRIIDADFNITDAATFGPGSTVDIQLGYGATSTSVFKGDIAAIELEVNDTMTPVLVVTTFDKSHSLGRATGVEVYKDQKYSDIISAIASAHGLSASVDSTSIVFPVLIKTSDDATFLDELTARAGMVWWTNDTTLHVKKADSSGSPVLSCTYGSDLYGMRVRVQHSDLSDSVKITGWDPASKQPIESTSSDLTLVNAPGLADDVKKVTPRGDRASAARIVGSVDEANELAKALHGSATSEEVDLRLEFQGSALATVGSVITLAGAGTKLAGNYFITEVEHVVSNGNWITRVRCGSLRPASLIDLAGRRPALREQMGPTIGIVTNVDPSGDGEKGVVKVKLPAYGENVETGWARLVSPGAGATRGLMLLPNVNDEVLVVFEHGDVRRPFVLGGLWGKVDNPPAEPVLESGAPKEWMLKTVSGHTLTFRDGSSDDKKNVEILLADGKTKAYIGSDKVEIWANQGKPLQLKSGNGTITINDKGEIEIKGAKITLTGEQEVAIKAPNVKINADSSIKAESSGTTEVKGTSVKIEGSAMTEVKGGMVKVN